MMNIVKPSASRKTLNVFLFLSLLTILIISLLLRDESLVRLICAFVVLFWLTLVPGSLSILVFQRRASVTLEDIVLGMGLGTATFPLLYLLFSRIAGWESFFWGVTAVNLLLASFYLAGRKRSRLGTIPDQGPQRPRITLVLMLLAIVSLAVLSREASQLRGNDMVIRSTQEIDTGYLMGLVSGLKNNGRFVDVHNSNNPAGYHYFAYLLMAAVSKFSGASILSMFQVVFPLTFFSFLSLAAFALAERIGANGREAFFAALLVLFLDDFSILNQLLKIIPCKLISGLFYTSWAIPNIHLSPSQLISIFVMFAVLLSMDQVSHNSNKIAQWLIPFLLLSTLVGFKSSTWVCFMLGLGIVSLLNIKKNARWFIFTLVSGLAGIAVSFYLFSGGGRSGLSLTDLNFAYPALKNPFFQNVFHYHSAKIPLLGLDLKLLLTALLLIPVWLLLTYGIRIAGLWRKLLPGQRNMKKIPDVAKIAYAAAFFGIVLSIFISMEGMGSANTYYLSIFGMFVILPFIGSGILRMIKDKRRLAGVFLAGVLSIQLASGLFYVAKPHLKKEAIAILSSDWLRGMQFIKNNTPKDTILISNRFDVSSDKTFSNYNEKFYFVPGFSERSVFVSGRGYNRNADKDYLERLQVIKLMFSPGSEDDISNALRELRGNYIVFDKWLGDDFPCSTNKALKKVFSNPALDIYLIT